MSYLGIDIGTSGCKAVIFEEDGSQLGSAHQSYEIISSQPSYAELDSKEVMEKCCAVIKTAVVEAKGSPVTGICISSQGEAFTPVGDNNEIIGNGMVSSDSRASSLVDEWTKKFGRERLYEITGHTAFSMFSLFKLLWLKENDSALFEQSKKFYCYEELLHMTLGLDPAISWPMAGRTMLFDINSHIWSEEILAALNLDTSRLARTLPTGSEVGTIPDDVANQLGLPSGVKVYTGGHDQTVCALGSGVIEEGTAMYAAGTVECICPVLSKPHKSEELYRNNLCCYDFTLKGKYTTVGYSLTGSNIFEWFKNNFGQLEILESEKTDNNVYELLLKTMDNKPTDLLVLPYFTPSGTPYFDAETKGAIVGLTLNTTRSEILKALLEGVSLEMRLNLDIMEKSGMKIEKFIAAGGATRSRDWVQLKSNVLNRPITVIEIDEAGCFGAAMIACSAQTGQPLDKLTSANITEVMQITPNPEQTEFYNQKFEKYKKLYPQISQIR
ncbi:MAG: FGGY-family carbohydrate kinase [Planctomycetota bacterium]|jgi:xylulokinase